jgi:hypothetical protein
MLLIGNRASVYALPRLLRPVTPAGSQPPFGVGLNPYLDHYSQAFAFSRVLYPLRRSPPLRSGDSGGLRLAPPQRANPAYHVSQFAPIDGVRAPLYTEGYHTCVGRPLKPTEPAPSHFGSGATQPLKLRAFTMRNTKASLTLPLPAIPRSRCRVQLTVPTAAACLRPLPTPSVSVAPP